MNAAARVATARLRRIALVLALIGAVLRIGFALLPLQTHLIILEDDAWMVPAIARNFALGLGISADGLNPTTGFQPLYPLTLGTLPYLLQPDALDAGFTANLLICAVLASLVSWPLWWLARHLGGELAGLLAVALYALNPSLIRLTVNAMETALGLLLLLTLFVAYYRSDIRRPAQLLGLALLTALATLARLDASLAFAGISLALSMRAWTEADAGLRARLLRLLPVAAYVLVTLLLLSPYFALNYALSGSFGPASGRALAFMQSYRGSFNLSNGLNALYQNSAIYLDWLPGLWLKLLVLLAGIAALVWLLGAKLYSALPLLFYLPVPPLYYGYLLQQIRERYFVGLSAILIILLALLAAELWRRWPARRMGWLLALASSIVIGLNSYEAIRFYRFMAGHPELTQPTSYQAALWIRDNLPVDVLIGAKNSGIYQYYSGHVVLNIDGKLNHEIVPVMEQRQLLDYLYQRGVRYLVDREQTMADHVMFYSMQFGPAPNHRTPNLTQRIEIYGKILANTFGANFKLDLDTKDGWEPQRPFSDVAELVKIFPRPNQADNPVVVYRLREVGAVSLPD